MNHPNNVSNNSLLNRLECPACHYIFISGYDPSNTRTCPSCKQKFLTKKRSDHGANNVYYKDGCPAIMSDGRFITYYNSTNELTETMRKLNNIKNPNEFRTFMQDNGNKFMQAERDSILRENTCSPQVACSEGWHKLQTQQCGDWANFDRNN